MSSPKASAFLIAYGMNPATMSQFLSIALAERSVSRVKLLKNVLVCHHGRWTASHNLCYFLLKESELFVENCD